MNKAKLENLLSSFEPEYKDYKLDKEAVDYLGQVINGPDTLKASMAVCVAGMDRGAYKSLSQSFILVAAHSKEPTVRIAAAAAAGDLNDGSVKNHVLIELLMDSDAGVRKFAGYSAKKSLPCYKG